MKKICNFGLFILKSGMSVDTNSLHRSKSEMASLEGAEEGLVAEDLPIRGGIHDRQ
jgi:hypothetical protein